MALEIANGYSSVYQNTYEVQKQQSSGQQAALKTEKAYFSKLAKLVPSVDCRIGTAYASV